MVGRRMGAGREMDGCGQCIKYTMFFANIIIFLGGMVVLGVGVWTLLDKAYITNLLGSNLFLGAVYILIATGGIVALIAFLGCLGAVKEVKCMLVTYFMIIFIVFVTMLVGGILGYVFREDVRNNLDKGMRASLDQYGRQATITEAWDETQTVLKCCGIAGPSDWKGNVPESCCKEATNGNRPKCNASTAYSNGCRDKAEKLIKDHASILGGTGIGVACLMIIGMIFSCVLFKMI